MHQVVNDTMLRLRKELLSLGGIKPPAKGFHNDAALTFMKGHLPNRMFPTSSVHEFECPNPESMAASAGFVSALSSSLFSREAVVAWIGGRHEIFPPAFTAFNIIPHHILCIQATSLKETLWATEEALRCKGFNVVVARFNGIDFKQSRRFQLAVESSGVTAFLMNTSNRPASANACVGRWKVEPIPSIPLDDLPGVGLPSWRVTLRKMRHGQPGSFDVYWKKGELTQIPTEVAEDRSQIQKWAV